MTYAHIIYNTYTVHNDIHNNISEHKTTRINDKYNDIRYHIDKYCIKYEACVKKWMPGYNKEGCECRTCWHLNEVWNCLDEMIFFL